MEATTVKQVLIAARWMIENVGWCQNTAATFRWTNGRTNGTPCAFCASGAINWTEAQYHLKDGALDRLHNACGDYIPTWNDTNGRTKQEVLDAYDRAIELENAK